MKVSKVWLEPPNHGISIHWIGVLKGKDRMKNELSIKGWTDGKAEAEIL